MKEKFITKGIKVPLYLFNYKFTKNEILTYSILNHFNKIKFAKENDLFKKFTIHLSKTNLNKLIPLSKDTIKKTLKSLNSRYMGNYVRIFEILNDDYFSMTLNLSSFNESYKKHGFIFIPVEILYNKNLNTIDKIVLSYIKGFRDSNKEFNFTNKYLSEKLNISEAVIKSTLKKLDNLNLIERNRENNSRTINIDQINIENYFENADIREIKRAKINKIKRVKTIEEANINHIENAQINIISLDQFKNINLTEEQKQYIREKLNL